MKKTDIPPDESYQIRCRKLGHQIFFPYCRSENRGLPCARVLDCWYHHFLVEEHLRAVLSADEWDNTFTPPVQPKILSLLDLIEQAKTAKNGGGE